MLQQTRMETVLPYFERFHARFPNVQALAEASEQEVLRLWSGLGYYRRARMLHAAARQVVEQFDGELPQSAAAWRRLPGVGEYTSAAVASQAFGERVAVVDGNVKRVAARYLGLALAADQPALHRQAAEWGAELMRDLPQARGGSRPAGDLNQALMFLGASRCKPRQPDCASCPIQAGCKAAASGQPEAWPLPAKKKAMKDLHLLFLVAGENRSWWLQARQEGWNPGLFEPPSLPDGDPTALRKFCRQHRVESAYQEIGEVRHTITHHRIRARVLKFGSWDSSSGLDPAAVPLSALGKKVLALAGYRS